MKYPPMKACSVLYTSESSTPQGECREQTEDAEAQRQFAHASPAILTIPRPFWVAPSKPVRDSAQPGP